MSSQNEQKNPGMKSFTVIWWGQMISIIGSGLTAFALGVWVYMETQSTVLFAATLLFARLPIILFSPLAGLVADRFDRRLVMIVSDSGGALTTLVMALLAATGHLEIWHVLAARLVYSICGAFQMPAYMSAISLFVPKEQLGNANGMVQLASAFGEIAAPVIAGALFVALQLHGLMLLDLATFLFALVTLLLIRFPRPAEQAAAPAQEPFLRQISQGWRYIATHPGIIGLLAFFMMINFIIGFLTVLTVPLILKLAGPGTLGLVGSVSGFGLLAGSIAMSVWGGPKRRINGVLAGTALMGTFLALMGLQPSIILITLGAFGVLFTVPIVQGCAQVILQSKVPADIQGRVFATVQALVTIATLGAIILASPLADQVFEPMLAAGGALAGSVGQFIGTGAGRGIGFMFMLMGGLTLLTALIGSRYARLRLIEQELPDPIDPMASAQDLAVPAPATS